MHRDPCELVALAVGASAGTLAPVRAVVSAMLEEGLVEVVADSLPAMRCEVLESAANGALSVGDAVLALVPGSQEAFGVIVGKVTRHRAPAHVVVQATQSLSLQCGEASLTLKANGQVLLKGDDVVVRAKGTQRIRAGHVAIN